MKYQRTLAADLASKVLSKIESTEMAGGYFQWLSIPVLGSERMNIKRITFRKNKEGLIFCEVLVMDGKNKPLTGDFLTLANMVLQCMEEQNAKTSGLWQECMAECRPSFKNAKALYNERLKFIKITTV